MISIDESFPYKPITHDQNRNLSHDTYDYLHENGNHLYFCEYMVCNVFLAWWYIGRTSCQFVLFLVPMSVKTTIVMGYVFYKWRILSLRTHSQYITCLSITTAIKLSYHSLHHTIFMVLTTKLLNMYEVANRKKSKFVSTGIMNKHLRTLTTLPWHIAWLNLVWTVIDTWTLTLENGQQATLGQNLLKRLFS